VERCNPAHGIDLQQLWAEVAQIEEQHWLTDEEAEWHAKAAKTHKAIGELSHVLEDIELRKEVNADEETWIHVTPHEILTRYSIRPSPKAYGDLTSALNFVGFRMKTIRGRRGYYLPSLNASLTAAQQAGLRLVTPPKK
jgi:hypothetical protein